MSRREQSFLVNLSKGMTLGDAALGAGYSSKNPDQSGYQALKGLRKKLPHLMEKNGISDDVLIQKYLVPALEATEKRVFNYRGKFVEAKPLPVWEVRTKALELVFRLIGLLTR